MRIFSRPQCPRNKRSTQLRRFRHLLLASSLVTSAACAQTLARPGWVGSGLSSQAWWRSAVIYRVQPQSFQDSNADGIGDLHGLALRLDYLQSIGVDAVLIESHTGAQDPEQGFDDLLSDASRHHIRILVPLTDDMASHSMTAEQAMNQARSWLRRGVAGIYVPSSLLSSIAAHTNFQESVSLLQELRRLADSFPGERVVICGDSPAVDAASSASPRKGPEIVDGTVDRSVWDAASLRTKLVLADSPATGEPLLQVARNSQHQQTHESILAALLLSSRGAVGLSYGQEIGLPNTSSDPIMSWTPSNLTHPHQELTEAKPKEEVYGTYHPYVPPAPSSVVGARPRLPNVALDTESAPPPVDPDTLPGFSTRPTSVTSDEKTINVAVEDNNPDSLLNFYRRVLQLHSGNATLRIGQVSFLNHDSEGALVWLRRAPAGARTVAPVVVVCNMTEHPIEISLRADLAQLHIVSSIVHPLLTSKHVDHVAQSVDSVRVSANSVYVGELHYR
jgi:alpha-glucosidase